MQWNKNRKRAVGKKLIMSGKKFDSVFYRSNIKNNDY